MTELNYHNFSQSIQKLKIQHVQYSRKSNFACQQKLPVNKKCKFSKFKLYCKAEKWTNSLLMYYKSYYDIIKSIIFHLKTGFLFLPIKITHTYQKTSKGWIENSCCLQKNHMYCNVVWSHKIDYDFNYKYWRFWCVLWF